MIVRKTVLLFLMLCLVALPEALAQRSLAFRGEGPIAPESYSVATTFDAATRVAWSVDSLPAPQQVEEKGGDVWRGLVTGLGIGAAAATITAVWVSAAADLDIEDVVDFYVPVVAAVGAAGGAVVEASKGRPSGGGAQMRVSLSPASNGLGVAAALWF